jgi:hypothetical protein
MRHRYLTTTINRYLLPPILNAVYPNTIGARKIFADILFDGRIVSKKAITEYGASDSRDLPAHWYDSAVAADWVNLADSR